MARLKKKDKTELDVFRQSCINILEENKNLDTLFANTDNLLEYSLSKTTNFNRDELYKQFAVMAGEDFAKLLMFCFDYFDDFATSIDLLKQLEIQEDLIERLKVLVSKYGPMYKRIKTKNFNELGWEYTRSNIVQSSQDLFMLEFIIRLNNESTFVCRDHPNSMLQLALHLLDGLSKINEFSPLNNDLISDLVEKVKLLVKSKE